MYFEREESTPTLPEFQTHRKYFKTDILTHVELCTRDTILKKFSKTMSIIPFFFISANALKKKLNYITVQGKISKSSTTYKGT